MDSKGAFALRRWIAEVNRLGEQYGHEEIAGTVDFPDADYVERFEAGETPQQVIMSDFPQPQPARSER